MIVDSSAWRRDPSRPFSRRYAEARSKFFAAARAVGLEPEVHFHPMYGRDEEPLALDVVRDGPADAPAVLLISSGCHGVEGYCGSGVQVALLRDAGWRAAVRASGVAVVYLHALNPHGFSWDRRTTHENVDLNRNFHDGRHALPANHDHEQIADLLVPPGWPPSAENEAQLMQWRETWGAARFQQAISGGQHTRPDGLFYGGVEPCWSQTVLRRALAEHAGRCERLAWIDVHTGLGPSGVGERIHMGPADAAALARARDWWGEAVTSMLDGSSSSAPLTGLMWTAVETECAQALYSGVALEFGTVPLEALFRVLRADQCLQNQGAEADPAQREAVRRQMRAAFYIDTPVWKQRVLEQAFDAAGQALKGLAGVVT